MKAEITIEINGERRTLQTPASLRELLAVLGIDERRVAVELNRDIVRRGDWENTVICDHDRLEIVQFVGGG